MPTRKIEATGNPLCKDPECFPFEDRPERGPLTHQFTPGLYEHMCPTCGRVSYFRITVQRV